MALALPLTKGLTEVPQALLLSKALTGQPDTLTALQHLPMPLCLPIAGLPFTILMAPSQSHWGGIYIKIYQYVVLAPPYHPSHMVDSVDFEAPPFFCLVL